jgi:hypothetical protein
LQSGLAAISLRIAADLIYIPIYFSRDLPLTGALYAVFLVMCCAGLRQWKRTLKQQLP